MDTLKKFYRGAKDTIGCFVGVIALPAIIISLLIVYLKLSDILFPEDPNVRIEQCASQKDRFQRDMFCGSIYEIGEQFLEDPTSTY